ncbi:MAG: DUF5024 domain-containing protein [Muribaculaceae bacterium]|nr:DUF5024 domain-containing protein [Muribaculaceae bacterium]
MKTLTSIIYFMLISCITFVASAQKNIDKAIAELENNPKADVTCTEKRNPDTKKTYKISKLIRFSGYGYYQLVRNAFIKDSKDAIEYTRQDGKMYHLIFKEKNCTMEYLLKRESGNKEQGQWLVTIEIKNKENYPQKIKTGKQKKRNKNISTYRFLNNGDLEYWNLSDTLFLDLSKLKELNNLDFDSLYQLNGLNIYYQNN